MSVTVSATRKSTRFKSTTVGLCMCQIRLEIEIVRWIKTTGANTCIIRVHTIFYTKTDHVIRNRNSILHIASTGSFPQNIYGVKSSISIQLVFHRRISSIQSKVLRKKRSFAQKK